MKTRYIILSALATLALAAGCQKEEDHYLDEIKVSSSYISIPEAGGSATFDVTSTGSWSMSSDFPEWLTVSPTSGSAGTTSVTLTAPAAPDGRTAEFKITCNGKTQNINVIQGLAVVSNATCAEVIAGPEAKTYKVTGVCTKIANTSYGNWYLDDGTGEIYIYGTVNSSGSYAWSSFNIEVGDVVTVQGPKTNYNGTIELVDATFISVQKSLVKIESESEFAFDADGGTFSVTLSAKGDGPFVEIPEDAQSWLSMTSTSKSKDEKGNDLIVIGFRVDPNETEDARSADIAFSSASGNTTSTVSASVSQMGLSGTLANPFTVADAIAYCQTLSGESGNEFYVKGKISRIASNGEFGSYGNATFFLSDDGEFLGVDDKNPDKEHDFEAYRVLYFGNEDYKEGANISVGDEVIICGKLTLYNGISETSSKKAYVYSINGATSGENGVGSLAYPFNVAGASNFIDNGGTANVYVKGIISRICANGEFGSYGNATFYISDNGTFYGTDDKTPGEGDFEAYRVLYLGNRDWAEGDTQIALGDEVILYGMLTKYGSTYETSSKKAYIYSLNGVTE